MQNGNIQSIFYKSDRIYKSNPVNVYFQGECNNLNYRFVDSLKGYIKETRLFLRDSTIIRSHFGKDFSDLKGIDFNLLTYEKKFLSIFIQITKDSLIDRIAIQRSADAAENPFRRDQTLLWLEFSTPTEIKDLTPAVYLEDIDGSIELKFFNKYFVKEIIYRSENSTDKKEYLITKYNFYKNNKIKEHGTILLEYGRIGKWYTYYENGKLQSEGEYCWSSFEYAKEYDIKKKGKWIYYTTLGCIDKEEIWEDGKLIMTESFNRD